MYPLRLRVSVDGVAAPLLDMEASRSSLLCEVKQDACKLCGIPDHVDQVVISHRFSETIPWAAGHERTTLHGLGFIDGHRLQLRPPRRGRGLALGLAAWQGRWARGGRGARPADGPAPVGLQNLGNTCYMRREEYSQTECLLAAPLLPEYFRGRQYEQDLNTTAALGSRGQLAQAFARLVWEVEECAKRGSGPVRPQQFKDIVSSFKEQFQGFEQHDAQEFLNVLLEGLSEDLNRTIHQALRGDEGLGWPTRRGGCRGVLDRPLSPRVLGRDGAVLGAVQVCAALHALRPHEHGVRALHLPAAAAPRAQVPVGHLLRVGLRRSPASTSTR
ncbi:unnamed protein product [Prorocentrum cordatum]|uniref:ubiquitinyl hydrolase 1 n=1 Tax=Prorocentrum cordatum TaxID=2364126 RepID=A0ABN9U7K8_9DINO|nr:unnamed protein product [Polarella glacialis]